MAKGETLSKIAETYGVSLAALKQANGIRNANLIRAGQSLKIPGRSVVEYTVRPGDSLSSIAMKRGVEAHVLARLNGLEDPDKIAVGQTLRIPAPRSPVPPLDPRLKRQLDAIKPRPGWVHIVIHHTGTNSGSAKALDRYHREQRNMKNGLAYHFLIGNGKGMRDGEIHIGNRWRKQLPGGHLALEHLNRTSIGISLVGNFEKTKPTAKQMAQLEALVVYLLDHTSVGKDHITTHTLIHPKHTLCPGRHFPFNAFQTRLP